MSEEKDKNLGKLELDFDVSQLLLHTRNIVLHGAIDANVSKRICEDLIGLDLAGDEPISLWINSPGGSSDCGFAIIDTMLGLDSPVHTFICGTASSMGALIALAGDKRAMTEHSSWMIHDLSASYSDGEYVGKIEARMDDYFKPHRSMIRKYLKSRSNLIDEDILKSEHSELNYDAKQCKAKGIIHTITRAKRKKK